MSKEVNSGFEESFLDFSKEKREELFWSVFWQDETKSSNFITEFDPKMLSSKILWLKIGKLSDEIIGENRDIIEKIFQEAESIFLTSLNQDQKKDALNAMDNVRTFLMLKKTGMDINFINKVITNDNLPERLKIGMSFIDKETELDIKSFPYLLPAKIRRETLNKRDFIDILNIVLQTENISDTTKFFVKKNFEYLLGKYLLEEKKIDEYTEKVFPLIKATWLKDVFNDILQQPMLVELSLNTKIRELIDLK